MCTNSCLGNGEKIKQVLPNSEMFAEARTDVPRNWQYAVYIMRRPSLHVCCRLGLHDVPLPSSQISADEKLSHRFVGLACFDHESEP